jgi:flagellar motor switch protein FliN/FliY
MDFSEARITLATAWAGAFTRVLETMTSTAPAVEWQAIEGALSLPEGGGRAWWADGVSNVQGPSIWIGATAAEWKSLGGWILGALGIEDAGDEDIESTCRDVVAQVASAFATALAKQLGTPLNSLGASPAEQPAGNALLVKLEATLPPASQTVPFAVAFLPSLVGASAGTEPAPPEEPAPTLSKPIAELRFPVYARLGVTAVQLGDVFRWTVGSVVEIGRRITDPIDVVIGDRLFAKGQVVVSNAHYGARLTSIERGETEAS